MTIRDNAYQLCKTITNSPNIEQVRSLIHRLNSAHFGYIARRLNAQVFGYLMVDQQRERLEKVPFPEHIPQLIGEERQLLEDVHVCVVQLNSQCAEPLRTALPNCAKAIDPYNKFQYNMSPITHGEHIIPLQSIDVMATSFRKHPAIDAALESSEVILNNIAESQYVGAVLKLTDSLTREGVFNAPQELEQVMFTQSSDSKYRLITRHLTALTCVRASLATLDQLIYQAILSTRLPALTDKNIIEIRGPSQHLAGNGLSIIYQPDQRAQFIEVGHIILVKYQAPQAKIDWLCQVEGVHMEVSRDFGQTFEVKLREIDANLNPFGPLLDHI